MKKLILQNIILFTGLAAACLSSLPAFADRVAEDQYISISGSDCSDSPSPDTKNVINLDCQTYYQTTNYTCGPAAVMTLMRYYGRLKPEDMNSKTELRIALEMGANDTGTTQAQMAGWLRDHGFNIDTGFKVQSDMIIKNLKQKTPTIITVNHHWILAKGLQEGSEPSEEKILFSDSCCGITSMAPAAIDSIWQEAELAKLHGLTCPEEGEYIVATPK